MNNKKMIRLAVIVMASLVAPSLILRTASASPITTGSWTLYPPQATIATTAVQQPVKGVACKIAIGRRSDLRVGQELKRRGPHSIGPFQPPFKVDSATHLVELAQQLAAMAELFDRNASPQPEIGRSIAGGGRITCSEGLMILAQIHRPDHERLLGNADILR